MKRKTVIQYTVFAVIGVLTVLTAGCVSFAPASLPQSMSVLTDVSFSYDNSSMLEDIDLNKRWYSKYPEIEQFASSILAFNQFIDFTSFLDRDYTQLLMQGTRDFSDSYAIIRKTQSTSVKNVLYEKNITYQPTAVEVAKKAYIAYWEYVKAVAAAAEQDFEGLVSWAHLTRENPITDQIGDPDLLERLNNLLLQKGIEESYRNFFTDLFDNYFSSLSAEAEQQMALIEITEEKLENQIDLKQYSYIQDTYAKLKNEIAVFDKLLSNISGKLTQLTAVVDDDPLLSMRLQRTAELKSVYLGFVSRTTEYEKEVAEAEEQRIMNEDSQLFSMVLNQQQTKFNRDASNLERSFLILENLYQSFLSAFAEGDYQKIQNFHGDLHDKLEDIDSGIERLKTEFSRLSFSFNSDNQLFLAKKRAEIDQNRRMIEERLGKIEAESDRFANEELSITDFYMDFTENERGLRQLDELIYSQLFEERLVLRQQRNVEIQSIVRELLTKTEKVLENSSAMEGFINSLSLQVIQYELLERKINLQNLLIPIDTAAVGHVREYRRLYDTIFPQHLENANSFSVRLNGITREITFTEPGVPAELTAVLFLNAAALHVGSNGVLDFDKLPSWSAESFGYFRLRLLIEQQLSLERISSDSLANGVINRIPGCFANEAARESAISAIAFGSEGNYVAALVGFSKAFFTERSALLTKPLEQITISDINMFLSTDRDFGYLIAGYQRSDFPEGEFSPFLSDLVKLRSPLSGEALALLVEHGFYEDIDLETVLVNIHPYSVTPYLNHRAAEKLLQLHEQERNSDFLERAEAHLAHAGAWELIYSEEGADPAAQRLSSYGNIPEHDFEGSAKLYARILAEQGRYKEVLALAEIDEPFSSMIRTAAFLESALFDDDFYTALGTASQLKDAADPIIMAGADNKPVLPLYQNFELLRLRDLAYLYDVYSGLMRNRTYLLFGQADKIEQHAVRKVQEISPYLYIPGLRELNIQTALINASEEDPLLFELIDESSSSRLMEQLAVLKRMLLQFDTRVSRGSNAYNEQLKMLEELSVRNNDPQFKLILAVANYYIEEYEDAENILAELRRGFPGDASVETLDYLTLQKQGKSEYIIRKETAAELLGSAENWRIFPYTTYRELLARQILEL